MKIIFNSIKIIIFLNIKIPEMFIQMIFFRKNKKNKRMKFYSYNKIRVKKVLMIFKKNK